MAQSASTTEVATLVTRLENPSAADPKIVTDWLVKLMMEGARFSGFWSGELLPPEDSTRSDWRVVQRFSTGEEARAWQTSDVRKKLVDELVAVSGTTGVKISDDVSNTGRAGDVATAISTNVKPGMEDTYFTWEAKIQAAQARSPGFRGTYLQPPAPGRQGEWSTLLKFDSPESLDIWFNSAERKVLLAEAAEIVNTTRFESLSNSFPGWFPVDKETGEGPPNWKTSMLVLLGLFPVVMLEIRFLAPHLSELNPALSSFISLVLSVIATTWGTMPIFIKCFTWWLFPPKENPSKTDVTGTLVMMALFAGEIAACWNLLPPKP